ncbi:MAG TPA: hypothetical protein VGF38_02905 [Ktedonobacterales bacterium]|jgi:virginiamycin B lyase
MPRSIDDLPDSSDLTQDSGAASPSSQNVLRHVPFTLFVCALVAVTLLVFSQAVVAFQSPRGIVAAPQPTATQVAIRANVRVVPAQMHIYPTTDPRASLMQPVVDREGQVWFGEMRANKLARLDLRSGEVREWDHPGGRFGLMMSTLGPDGAVWFTEENSGYIGRFDPTTERFTIFPLAAPSGDSPGPQHLQFDQHGQLWFTLNHSSQIARLDPATGAIRAWDVLPVEGERAPHPYSLAVTPEGIVWFGAALYGGVVGSLDPSSGAVTVHRLGRPTAQITSMASDKRGNVWFTELQFNRLGQINTRTGEVTEIALPEPVGATTGNYALDVAPDGAVWITSFDANAIIRYTPESNAFTFYTLLVPNSVPFGMVVASDGTVWFTSDGEPNDYIGHIFP